MDSEKVALAGGEEETASVVVVAAGLEMTTCMLDVVDSALSVDDSAFEVVDVTLEVVTGGALTFTMLGGTELKAGDVATALVEVVWDTKVVRTDDVAAGAAGELAKISFCAPDKKTLVDEHPIWNEFHTIREAHFHVIVGAPLLSVRLITRRYIHVISVCLVEVDHLLRPLCARRRVAFAPCRGPSRSNGNSRRRTRYLALEALHIHVGYAAVVWDPTKAESQ